VRCNAPHDEAGGSVRPTGLIGFWEALYGFFLIEIFQIQRRLARWQPLRFAMTERNRFGRRCNSVPPDYL
jgi:hypothetical protein